MVNVYAHIALASLRNQYKEASPPRGGRNICCFGIVMPLAGVEVESCARVYDATQKQKGIGFDVANHKDKGAIDCDLNHTRWRS